jgi:patatin-like phospholipase/acyl hydrolase
MTFQILALSGGGFRGLYTAHILAELERAAGKPLARCFDLLAGTSVGGILALGLSAEIPAAQMRDKFGERGKVIFSDRRRPKNPFEIAFDFGRSFFKPKYDGIELRRTIESMLGKDTLLGNAKHRVIVPAVNMTKGAIQIFKTPHHNAFVVDHALHMTDIAMATSAAPTYFPMASVKESLFVDGGIFANAPDFCALHEARYYLEIPQEEIRIISIGSTTSGYSLSHAKGANYGAFRWFSGGRLISTTISAQQQLTDFTLKHLLGDGYLRLDEPQSHEQAEDLALDVATDAAKSTILGLANATVQRSIGSPTIRGMLNHAARPPRFYYGPNAAAE